MSEITVPRVSTRPTAVSALLAIVSTAVVGSLLCLAVARVAIALGASAQFQPFVPMAFVAFVVIGSLGGIVGWAILRRVLRHPYGVLRWLVPVVFLVSLVPDVLVGATRAMPGATWGAVAGLMVMHLLVTVCLVTAAQVFLPVRRRVSPR